MDCKCIQVDESVNKNEGNQRMSRRVILGLAFITPGEQILSGPFLGYLWPNSQLAYQKL